MADKLPQTTGSWGPLRRMMAQHVNPRPGKAPFQWRWVSLREVLSWKRRKLNVR